MTDRTTEDELDRRALADEGDVAIEIARLARLSTIEYERDRKTVAQRMGVRIPILDRLVEGERARLGLSGGATDGKQGHAVSFPEPEPWPEPVDGASLLNGIAAAIRQHVVLTDHARDITALWTLHTYLFDRFLVSPRLGISSPTKGCGKTLLLDVLSRLVARPLPTTNVTPAAIFRVVEAHHPTLLIDEADTFLYDNDELRGVLNGNRKGSKVLRTVGDDHEPRAFAIYSACAIALIGRLPDTLNDRSAHVELKRRLPSEQAEPFRPDRADHLDELARKAVRWTKDNAVRVGEADPEMPDGIINRAADNLRPLLAIADAAGGEWPQRARKASEASRSADDHDASRLELLLGDIRDVFKEIEMSSADLVKGLVAIEGRPWAELGKSRKPLTQNGLARMLKPLGIGPDKIGPETKRLNGYKRDWFKDAFARFLPPQGASEPDIRTERDEMGTSDDFKMDSHEPGCPVEKCEKPNNDGVLSTCPVAKGFAGEKAKVTAANGNAEPGLSRRRVQELADWYSDEGHQRYCDNTLDTAALDAELRGVLAEEVFPEFVEIEFERVMKVVFEI